MASRQIFCAKWALRGEASLLVVDLDHNVEPRQLCTPVKLITQTWSGRGKQPLWFVQALKKRDTTAESLLIDGGAKAVKKGAAKKLAKTAAKKKA